MTVVHGWRDHRDAVARNRFLRLVNWHNTPASSRDRLRADLARYSSRLVGATFDDLVTFFDEGHWPDDRPRFLPVFYEGYANHVQVAAPVLEELGLVGWFPVCTAFVACPVAEQEVFARSHFIAVAPEEHDGRRLAMTWDEVGELSRRHVVFPHTASHDGIGETVTDADLEREVAEPWREMTARTGGRAVPAFAWMGGTPWGASDRHDAAVTAAGYRFVVSNTMIQRIG